MVEDDDGGEGDLPVVSKEQRISTAINKVLALSRALDLAVEELGNVTGTLGHASLIGRPKRGAMSKVRAVPGFNLLAVGHRPARLARTCRQWAPRDRKMLAKMKAKGYTDEQIDERLNRSTRAISQQWRKQRPD